ILSAPLLEEHPCDPEILAATRALAGRLADMGHAVIEGPLPLDLDEVAGFWGRFGQVGLAQLRAAVPAMPEKAAPQYLAMADEGNAVPARDLLPPRRRCSGSGPRRRGSSAIGMSS
ncbi:hypothetical protein ACSQ8M_24790, partial [Marinovum sp. B10]